MAWTGHAGGAALWPLAHGRQLELGRVGRLMGIVNVTPDSFSDGGRSLDVGAALARAASLIEAGAEIVDIGGESTRPGAEPVDAATEQSRILPVIENLAASSGVLISVDTYRAETAARAVDAGAHIVNDVWGLQREPEIAAVAKEKKAGLVVMHTGRERSTDPDPVADQHRFLDRSLQIADEIGIEPERIVLDPGFGFAKDTRDNLALMARFGELHAFGRPLLVGTSRKRFLGAVSVREEAGDRDIVTAASTAILRMAGAAIFRVHDVAANADALRLADAVMAARDGRG